MKEVNIPLEQKLARLTPREKEVFRLICTGLPNKVVAPKLGVTERTIEAHRAHIFQKMDVRNLAHLLYILSPHNAYLTDAPTALKQSVR